MLYVPEVNTPTRKKNAEGLGDKRSNPQCVYVILLQ